MNNSLQVFNFEGANVRTVMIDDEPYFVGKDVAEVLGYSSPSATVSKKVREKYKGVAVLETPSGKQETTIISEPGIYQLINGSKLESAEKFQDWVYEEVLPTIRKTGSYQPPLTVEDHLLAATQGLAKQVETVVADVEDIKGRMELSSTQQFQLQKAGNYTVIQFLGGKDSEVYGQLSRKVFSALWRDFKNYFELPAYRALPTVKFDEGLAYVKNWQPDMNLNMEIAKTRRQKQLLIGADTVSVVNATDSSFM